MIHIPNDAALGKIIPDALRSRIDVPKPEPLAVMSNAAAISARREKVRARARCRAIRT